MCWIDWNGSFTCCYKLKTLKQVKKKKPYIRINIRELDRVPSIGLFTLYTLDY